MTVFLVPAAQQTAANSAAREQMFRRAVPFEAITPTHYVAGWDNIPAPTKAAILAAGAVEYPDLESALVAAGAPTNRTAEEKLADVAAALDAITDPVLVTEVVQVIRGAIA